MPQPDDWVSVVPYQKLSHERKQEGLSAFGSVSCCLLPSRCCGSTNDAQQRRRRRRSEQDHDRHPRRGLALAVIDHGKAGDVQAYGIRNAKGDPLTKDTVMYGASLTKTVFAYTVMQLVDPGKLNLDTPPSIGAAPNSSGEFG